MMSRTARRQSEQPPRTGRSPLAKPERGRLSSRHGTPRRPTPPQVGLKEQDMRVSIRVRFALIGMFLPLAALHAQGANAVSEGTFANLHFRAIGPATPGGRIDDFAVLETNPSVFYVATAAGGLWKTMNSGTTWEVLFNDQAVVSIGDVAIPRDNANLVWVGSGENNNRQSSSWGGGVFKSTDGGKTWRNMGLRNSTAIARIIVDPVDFNVVYVASLG